MPRVRRDLRALEARLSARGPSLLVVAGPNGAGKTTFVQRFIKPTRLRIVNPDDIARALDSEAPETVAYEAAKLAETIRQGLVERSAAFCMETVFSDPVGAKIDFLRQARGRGYALIFDNSSTDEPYRLVAEFEDGKVKRRGLRPAWFADTADAIC